MKEQTILKIGEFARIAQVSIATLRHYDQCGLLKPATLDADSGYRYYALEQLPRLNRILALKEMGFSLEQIVHILEERLSLEQLQGMFKLKQAQTQQMIDAEQARLARIAVRLRQIEQEGKMPHYEVLLKQTEPLLAASYRAIVPLPAGFEQSYAKISAYLHAQGIEPGAPAIFVLHARSEQHHDGIYIDAEALVPIAVPLPDHEQITTCSVPGGQVASTIHTGAELFLGQAYAALYKWMNESGYQLAGFPRLLRLRQDRDSVPTHNITEIQFPVQKSNV